MHPFSILGSTAKKKVNLKLMTAIVHRVFSKSDKVLLKMPRGIISIEED